MNQLKYFTLALRTEVIKMKNTLGVWTALIFPLFVVFMNFMIYHNRPKALLGGEINPWIFISRNAVSVYSILFLPLFIAVITFYINYNEHKSNAWRQIYALPIPKGSVYTAKLFMSFMIICSSMLFFYLINYASIIILKSLHPEIPFDKYIYDSIIWITFVKITLASAGILAIQFVISILFGNFIYPLGFGLLATFAGAFLMQWEKIIYYPYAYPFQAALDMMKGNYTVFNQNIIFSLLALIFFAVSGYVIHFKLRIK
jgi:lantibiotic transport system permease protein